MKRKEAVTLLKEMSVEKLAEFSWVVLQQRKRGDYQLQLGSNCDSETMAAFIDRNDLVFEEDSPNRYLFFRKPQ